MLNGHCMDAQAPTKCDIHEHALCSPGRRVSHPVQRGELPVSPQIKAAGLRGSSGGGGALLFRQGPLYR